MTAFFELKHQADEMMIKAGKLARDFGYASAAENIEEIRKNFLKKEMMVVAAGEARRGKSTLLNALLNEKTPLFPVDVNVCTNVVTIVRYGAAEKVEAYMEVPGSDELKAERITRDQIENYVSEKGNPNNYKNVKLLNIEIPNDLLKEGVVFVDTPGVGSLNISHAEATYAFLPNADLLLFVSDTNSGFTETELNFLKRGYQYCKNVIFPLTKKDLNANYPVIAEDNREKIERTLGIPDEEIEIIPVSSTAKLRYLERGSKAMYVNSNYQQFEDTIWGTIAKKRADLLIMPFVSQVREELLKVADSIATQYQLLNADKEKTKELIVALNDEIHNMESFQQDSAQWRNQLNYFCTVMTSQTNTKVQNIGTDARSYLESCVTSMRVEICKENVYTQIICDINDLITRGLLNIKEDISNDLEDEVSKIQSDLKLDIDVNRSALDGISFVPNDKLNVSFPERRVSDRLISSGRKIGINSMAGGAVGGIIGGIIGFCIGGPGGAVVGKNAGAIIGGAFGTTKGCVESINKHDEVDVGIVNRAIAQHISTSVTNMNSSLVTTIAQLRMSLTTEFELMLKKRVKEIQENIGKMQKNINMVKSEVPGKLAALKKQNDAVKSLLQMAENTENQITALGSGLLLEKMSGNQAKPFGSQGNAASQAKPFDHQESGAVRPKPENSQEAEGEKDGPEYGFL
ncbi:MAG: dynamin family protein [Clostridiales bacterium]|nr:dynamin family protein [Clostridiales bacterium]